MLLAPVYVNNALHVVMLCVGLNVCQDNLGHTDGLQWFVCI